MITIAITITSVGVQCQGAFIPTLGSEGPQWGPGMLMGMSLCLSVCPSLFISVSLSRHLHCFLLIINARSVIARSACSHATGSNLLNCSIIFPSVCLSVQSSTGLLRFCIYIEYF